MISIKGLDKAEVLLELWKSSHAQGMSFLSEPRSLDLDQAKADYEASKPQGYFDYYRGRVLKVNLQGDEFDPYFYDRDNYQGAAADAIGRVREAVNG